MHKKQLFLKQFGEKWCLTNVLCDEPISKSKETAYTAKATVPGKLKPYLKYADTINH